MDINFDSKELSQLLDSNTFRIEGCIDGNNILTEVTSYKILDNNKIELYATDTFSIDTEGDTGYDIQSFTFDCKITLTCILSISSLMAIIEDNIKLNILDKTDYTINLDMIGSCRWDELEHAFPDFYAGDLDIDEAEFIHALANELAHEKTGKMLERLIKDTDIQLTDYDKSDSDYYKNIVSDLLNIYECDWYDLLNDLYNYDIRDLMSKDFDNFVQENYTDKLLKEYQNGTSYYEVSDYRTDRSNEDDELLLYKA